MDVTEHYQLVPSLLPDDLWLGDPSPRDTAGCVVLLEEAIYLVVRFEGHAGTNNVGYLNLKSGEICFKIDHDHNYISRRWRVESIDQNPKPEIVLKYLVDIPAHYNQ